MQIFLAIAEDDDTKTRLNYAIESFIDPKDEHFYKPYILVKEGQEVKKGDVIAHMYLTPEGKSGTHIHYNLMQHGKDKSYVAPSIFTPEIMQKLTAKFKEANQNLDDGVFMGDCMGYKIAAEENPYEDKAEDCLK